MTATAEKSGRLTDAEAIQRLKEVERATGLYSIRVGQWSVWPLLKMSVMLKMTALELSSRRASPGAAARAGLALRDAAAISVARPRRILIKTATSTMVDVENGKYKDYIFDDLLAVLPSFHKIDAVIAADDVERRRNALVPPLASTAGPELGAALGSRVGPSAEDRAAGEKIARILRTELGLNDCDAQWATFRIAHFGWSRASYKAMLRRLCTDGLVVADPGEHAAIAAARELGLSSVELQHGFLNADHPGYEYSQVDTGAASSIPMPDQLFVFGDYWKRILEEMPFWRGRIIAAGSLRLDSYRRLPRQRSSGRTILFTTQGIDTPSVIRFLQQAWSQVAPDAKVRLVIKLHPLWDADPSPYAVVFGGDERVSVIPGSSEPNTLKLLTATDLHLSISSTCHYEACALGVPTVVLPFATSDNMAAMIAAGHAVQAQSPDHLAALMRGSSPLPVDPSASSFYFAPNARENMRQALDQILAARRP